MTPCKSLTSVGELVNAGLDLGLGLLLGDELAKLGLSLAKNDGSRTHLRSGVELGDVGLLGRAHFRCK